VEWYDRIYANDPSTDNIFGREALVPRRDPLLHDYLRRGGRLSQFHVQQKAPALALALCGTLNQSSPARA
jgi:hypothetical protein